MQLGSRARAGGIAIALSLALAVPAAASAAERPAFGASGAMQPDFDWRARDYALRGCDADPPLELSVRGAKGWTASVGVGPLPPGPLPPGNSGVQPDVSAGEAVTVAFKKRGRKSVRRYHLRCLPDDFPGYKFERESKGGPRMFSIQLGERYGAVFDRFGAPLWWVQAKGEPTNISVLADGTMTWSPVDELAMQVADLEVRTIRNKLLHRFSGAPGSIADVHELLLLPNGNYMFGAQVTYNDDASEFGGSPNSEVIGIEIQEFTPNGKEVWSWSSRGKIGLEETGRWWDLPILDDEPYDVVHWNSVEKDGRFILVSMRHTDAVYKVDTRTGKIVWKLGGTPTPDSLEVLGDPLGDYPLGGQHDARVEPDGTVTIFDNRTALTEPTRAVRYEINENKNTARLVESVTDPDVTASFCCGDARLLDSGDWMIGWGGNPEAGSAAYDELGNLIFRLTLDVGFTYRATPVPKGAVNRKGLRKAMESMAG
jgi:hypothetical protein